ncbi:hypothetical protein AERO9AM_20008 [Aeromicrobium sp. 9AM]|nr:hypothetical protein AERO9AM_20008 [Aeromicrobium sp. 9AM]
MAGRRAAGMKGPLAHPTELTDPCCLPALGELGDVSPREGLLSIIRSAPVRPQVGRGRTDSSATPVDR